MRTISTANFAPDDMDYTDPPSKYKDLEFMEHRSSHLLFDRPKFKELCWVCGWNTRNQKFSSYGSRVRVIHTGIKNSAIWTIGTQWLLRDEPNDRYLGNNYITLKFLHKQPGLTIPLPKEVRSLSQPMDPIYFTLESRVPGDTLYEVWPTLSQEAKASYSRQLGDAIRQLRQFTAPRPQAVDGSQLSDSILGKCASTRPGSCFKIPYNHDEWLDGLGADIRMGLSRVHNTTDPVLIEEKFQEAKAQWPASEPYVLTHGDLNLSNIIVKDGKIQGIIDWERSGYYPWWVERVTSYYADAPELFEPIWKELMPEMDGKKWTELIDDAMVPAEDGFRSCSHLHGGSDTTWWRPAFSETDDVHGEFRMQYWGQPLTCEINQLSPEQQALLETYKRKDPRALEMVEDPETPPNGGDESK